MAGEYAGGGVRTVRTQQGWGHTWLARLQSASPGGTGPGGSHPLAPEPFPQKRPPSQGKGSPCLKVWDRPVEDSRWVGLSCLRQRLPGVGRTGNLNNGSKADTSAEGLGGGDNAGGTQKLPGTQRARGKGDAHPAAVPGLGVGHLHRGEEVTPATEERSDEVVSARTSLKCKSSGREQGSQHRTWHKVRTCSGTWVSSRTAAPERAA